MPIPANTPHAVSVTLPTWEATVGYEEGQEWVTLKMNLGYPRFFIHSIIKELAKNIEKKYGRQGEQSLVLSSYNAAKRAREFIRARLTNPTRVLRLSTRAASNDFEKSSVVEANFGVVFFKEEDFTYAKQYWQHSGEGISSRKAEYVLKEMFENEKKDQRKLKAKTRQELQAQRIQKKSPSISASIRSSSQSGNEEVDKEFTTFIEQKYGRVLDLKFADDAKKALRRRIGGQIDQTSKELDQGARRCQPTSEKDVYLYPTGMTSIFHAHQACLKSLEPKKSVCFGFPYVDTLNILRKFGPGVHFLGFGDDASLDQLEKDLDAGTVDIMALFCECPSNPLLKTPDLARIRKLANKFGFAVVVDETVGNFLNICVLPYADIVVSSLTKVFSGDSNVMAGSLVLNPDAPLYPKLKHYFDTYYEDLLWAEDALHLERNSRDFEDRSHKINETSTHVVDLLVNHPLISKVYYPGIVESKRHYDRIKTADGGYGGLISFEFHDPNAARIFFNTALLHKGPSLGTNFTLACPYAILAHYQELEEIAQWGVDENLIRISVGLEDKHELLETLKYALDKASNL